MGARGLHREIFFAYNGPGPYLCFECDEEVEFAAVLVHHMDENHGNNDPKNLTAAHKSCHRKYHNRTRVISQEERAKRRRSMVGQKRTPEQRARLAQAATGRILGPETRAKIAKAARGRTHSPETRAKIAASCRINNRWTKT